MNFNVKYDKRLNKYHIDYERVKDKQLLRWSIYDKLNESSDLTFIIETHLGSVTKPDPTEFTRNFEQKLANYRIPYIVKPIEIRVEKGFLGLFSFNKKPIRDFMIAFCIRQGTLEKEMFDHLLCEYDLQSGYYPREDTDDFFTDMEKGYITNENISDYFSQTFYDSRLFNKYLATEDLILYVKDSPSLR